MFCDRCQDILNLDILLSTWNPRGFEVDEIGGPNSPRRPHHKNCADLNASVEAGCTIRSLVYANPDPRPFITRSQSGKIYFSLHPSGRLVFEFDILHETEHSLSGTSQVFAFIRLTTNEGMCIRYSLQSLTSNH